MSLTPMPFAAIAADPVLVISWIATSSAALGTLVGTVVAWWGLRWERATARIGALLVLPLLVIVLGVAIAPSALSDPLHSSMVVAGLVLLGAALAPWDSARARHPPASIVAAGLARAAALLLIAAFLDGAAAGWGLLEPRPPWSPGVTARLLDLSPRALVLEAGGADWMRHEAVYGPAGTDRLGPGIRAAWDGSVAGPLMLVVGCTAAVFQCGARAR